MEKQEFGLLGKNIAYSFSKKYFEEKFKKLFLKNHSYNFFDISEIENVTPFLENPNLIGMNVTIPYKQAIIPFLDGLSDEAQQIGAVNCVSFKNGKKIGYNTDAFEFEKTLLINKKDHHKKALILGTGGASKAIAYALRSLKIEYDFVSRNPDEFQIYYDELNAELFEEYTIIINTTPVGTFPNIDESPNLDYSLFTKKHIAFDLVYNPEESLFLKQAKANNATTKNGYEMLVFQAEKAWKIWNK